MLVLAADILSDTDPETAGDVALFAGRWVPQQPPPDLYNGDLVVRLTRPANPTDPQLRAHTSDIEMLLAHHGRWQRVGHWLGIDNRWPAILAPTAAAIMGLAQGTAADTSPPATPTTPPRPLRRGGAIRTLLDASLLAQDDEFIWHCHSGVSHTVRLSDKGTLLLPDGRAYTTPTGATTALGGSHQNGWHAFTRLSDGHTLAELRAKLQARHTR
jgi:hypothetical protein